MITNPRELAEGIGFLLTDQGFTLDSTIHSPMSAAGQRHYFGVYLGRGTIIVNGRRNTITRRVTCGFGAHYLDVAMIDATNPARSYFDITRDFSCPDEFREFLAAVGGRITEDQIEGDV